MSLETERAVSRISWCPTRPGLLASLARDSAAVVLHDIMSWAVGHEDGESSVQVQQIVLNIFLSLYIYFYPPCQDRMVEPPTDIGGHVAAFAWHPRDENTLLVAGNYGRWVTVSANQSPVSDISLTNHSSY